jgi:hypothetical protein
VLVLGWALDLVAVPARPATLAAGRFLGRGSAERLRVAERRREHERELHGGVTPHGEVGRWWGRGRKESGCGGRGRGARACERWLAFAVPVRELMVFSDAKSDISVAGTENARSNRPSAIAWRPAPSCGLSRAPRRRVERVPRSCLLGGFGCDEILAASKKSRVFFLVQEVVSRKGRRRRSTSGPSRGRAVE